MNKTVKTIIKNVLILIVFFSIVLTMFFLNNSTNKNNSLNDNDTKETFHNFQGKLNKELKPYYDEYLESEEVEQIVKTYLSSYLKIKINDNELNYDNTNHIYTYQNKNCFYQFYFRSELEDLTGSIAAYIMATDAALSAKGTQLTDLNDFNSYLNAVSEVKTGKVFKIDTNLKHFDEMVSYGYNDRLIIINQKKELLLGLSEYPFNNGYHMGRIEIPLYYDLSTYRKDELLAYFENDDLNEKYDLLEELSTNQKNLYSQYFDLTGNKDYRNYVFYPLRGLGLIMYTPISGLNSNFSYGKRSYSNDIGILDELQNKSKWEIWNVISDLDQQGLCSTRSYIGQCTSFANYWFYLQHGYDPLMGNGNHMAAALVRDLPDLFEDGCVAAAGGIVSIGSANKANHVICIDAVDYENNIITISEANTYGYANIRLRVEYSFEEFELYCQSICKSMCNGNIEGFYINYANPINK